MRSVLENAYIDRVKTGKESELYKLIQREVHTHFILCETLYLGELYGYLIGTRINCFEANFPNKSEIMLISTCLFYGASPFIHIVELWDETDKLTNCIQQSTSSVSNMYLASPKNSPNFMDPEDLLARSQQPAA